MLKPMRHCACCGTEMTSVRNTKEYCSDACRKKAARSGTDIEQQAESRWIVECLGGLVGQIWPLYSWDNSPPVFALMVSLQMALDELNFYGDVVTEAELECALRDCGIETSEAGDRLKAEIKALYDARKDRRFARNTSQSSQAPGCPTLSTKQTSH